MENKLISLIIPAYNSSEYIEACLNSAKSLLDDRMEIIVIDDGSQDNTSVIVKEQICHDNRIRLIKVENGGVSRARNIGLDNASGKYIMFLDADDYFIEEAFESIKDNVENDLFDFVAFSRKILERNGKTWHQEFNFEGTVSNEKTEVDRIAASIRQELS